MNTIQARLKQANPDAMIGSEVAVVPLLHQALGRNLRTALLVLLLRIDHDPESVTRRKYPF